MDYRKYRCNLWERLGCLAAGTAVAAAIAWLFYRSWYGMVLVIPVNYLIVSYYKNKKRDERAKKLMIEFRDAIQAVAAALLAGYIPLNMHGKKRSGKLWICMEKRQ